MCTKLQTLKAMGENKRIIFLNTIKTALQSPAVCVCAADCIKLRHHRAPFAAIHKLIESRYVGASWGMPKKIIPNQDPERLARIMNEKQRLIGVRMPLPEWDIDRPLCDADALLGPHM